MKTENQSPALATKVITGKVRFSYAHVWEAVANDENSKPKFSVALLIPKSDKKTIAAINRAVEAAKQQGKTSKFGGKLPVNLKLPLRDGDEERPDDEVYSGHYFVNASALTKPGIVDKDRNPIMDKEDFYSGCYGIASVNFYPFAVSGNKGIACGLNNLMKTQDGEPLGGRISAEDDFAEVEISEEAEDLL
ncbi:MAG TPA: DUF2815 family protein [Chitinophagaceae bacterium]|nr:DUF2815 family protein [Chitinophagaceae bacterium]